MSSVVLLAAPISRNYRVCSCTWNRLLALSSWAKGQLASFKRGFLTVTVEEQLHDEVITHLDVSRYQQLL